MIKAVFFDNDGVLVSTEHLVYEANQAIFDQLKISYSLDDFKDHTLFTSKGSAGFLKDRGFDDDFNKKFKALRAPVWKQKLVEEDHSIVGVSGVLKILKKELNLELALTTSSRKEQLELGHTHDELLNEFDYIFTREKYKKIKPAPDVYLHALEVLGLNSDEVLVIEDAPRGISSGKRAGLSVVAIPHGFTKELDLSEADYHLESILELPALIKELNKLKN